MTNYMQMALKLAKNGESLVSPNPLVGCVIEKNNKIIGVGWHKGVGCLHAEVEALHQAGAKAKRANVYVNLEPCCHFGKTPPCADALIKAQINSVHIPFLDPNPLVNGKGVKKLRQAGIEVYIGEEFKNAKWLNEIFLHYIVHKTPFVVAKWAMTLDGKIATRNFDSKWITEIAARKNCHKLRQNVDAILIGVGTVIADDPMLTPYLIHNFNDNKIPLKIILDPLGNTPLTSNILKFYPEETLIITTTHSSLKWRSQIKMLGANLWNFKQITQDEIDLKVLLRQLGKLQISSVLVEGGAKTLGAFFKANLVNKVCTYIAPKLLGDAKALSPLANNRTAKILNAFNLNFARVETIGGDLLVISYPKEQM